MAKKVQKPEKCIKVEEARELHDNWCKKRGKRLQKKLGFEDAREFHWSVAELEEYLAYVKQESKEQGITDPGIRIYLGAYSKEKCKKLEKGRVYDIKLNPKGEDALMINGIKLPENSIHINCYIITMI